MGKNLFSLTERLPKSKYRQISSHLHRDISLESVVMTSAVHLVTPQAVNNFKLKSVGSEELDYQGE